MCENCGCGHVESYKLIPMREKSAPGTPLREEVANPSLPHSSHYSDSSQPSISYSHFQPVQDLPLHLPILARNDNLAGQTRARLASLGIFAINFVSSPGSGKTTFLAKTLEKLGAEGGCAVIVGDLETTNDAVRLRGKGAPVVQVTTGTVCHLDAEMIARSLDRLDLAGKRLLFIENVGNLVCPASFDLGESMRVVLLSVTEGEDKPLKYPPIFRGAKLVVITKTDLLAATGIDLAEVSRNIQAVAPEARIVAVSAKTGEGMQEWLGLLEEVALSKSAAIVRR